MILVKHNENTAPKFNRYYKNLYVKVTGDKQQNVIAKLGAILA